MIKYVAYDAENCEYEYFATVEQAKFWLRECFPSDELKEGLSFIAEVIFKTAFVETDKKENYHVHSDNCPLDCYEEEWPYDDEYDFVGRIDFLPVDKE